MQKEIRQQQLTNWLTEVHSGLVIAPSLIFGDASFRRYFRYTSELGSGIGVDAPPEHENCRPFVALSHAYQQQGILAPRVIAWNQPQGFMALSDLGDEHLARSLQSQQGEVWFERALTLLPKIAMIQETQDGSLPSYDAMLLEREMCLFPDWLLARHLSPDLLPKWQQFWPTIQTLLIDNALQQPQVGVHRDFHSRNLMRVDEEIAVLDYQDAVIGPLTYDLVSLLRDCYWRMPADQLERLLSLHYLRLQQAGLLATDISWPQFKRWFDLMGVQRHLKAAGIFARLCYRDGKAEYLTDVPRVLSYLIEVGREYSELAPFADWLEESVLSRFEAIQ